MAKTKWMVMKKLFKGQNGVCVIICMIVIVGLLFVQITALIVDIINVPRKGLASEEMDFLFGIVLQRKSDATAITRKVMITPLKIGVAILSMMKLLTVACAIVAWVIVAWDLDHVTDLIFLIGQIGHMIVSCLFVYRISFFSFFGFRAFLISDIIEKDKEWICSDCKYSIKTFIIISQSFWRKQIFFSLLGLVKMDQKTLRVDVRGFCSLHRLFGQRKILARDWIPKW
ncbi:hypothetical protein RhiirA1_396395 [Rhizophagus irregularis]|uniref:Uncharacterized protein n=1 Tax=Rhizophagus irregularis TaxID=588596 RepID=A0A2N0RL34_9GLOM|nr:hypothetical protein RhiirA1_396395 [Rhizophagus irregularis]